MKVSIITTQNGGHVNSRTNFDSYKEAVEYMRERVNYLRDENGKEGVEFEKRPLNIGGAWGRYDIFGISVEKGHDTEFANRHFYGKVNPF